jgi:biopolymer transport protein ExbD/TolR
MPLRESAEVRIRKHRWLSFSGLPSFALAAAIVYFIAFAIFLVLWAAGQRNPIGLGVHLLKPGPAMMNSEPLIEPMMLRLELTHADAPPKVYLQSKLVAWSSLDGALKDELKLRPERVVYVAADPDLSWTDVVNAIDLIRGAQAEAVLLTYRLDDARHSKKAVH